MLGQLVLLLAEDPALRRSLRTALNHGGAQLLECRAVAEALEQLGARRPELVLADLRLAEDAVEAIGALRARSDASLIAILDASDEAQRVAGLDAGADDVVSQPFSKTELLARVRAALRRSERSRVPHPGENFSAGGLEIDFVARDVRLRGKPVHLTPTEYKLLGVLVASAGKVVSHERLLEAVWGSNAVGQVQYLRVYMKQLRVKLERVPTSPQYLLTEPGIGYRLRLPT